MDRTFKWYWNSSLRVGRNAISTYMIIHDKFKHNFNNNIISPLPVIVKVIQSCCIYMHVREYYCGCLSCMVHILDHVYIHYSGMMIMEEQLATCINHVLYVVRTQVCCSSDKASLLGQSTKYHNNRET